MHMAFGVSPTLRLKPVRVILPPTNMDIEKGAAT